MLRWIFLFALIPFHVHASWICREAASDKNGNFIIACGVAQSVFESEARENALKAAQRELESICNTSPDCNNFDVIIKPLRTDCEKAADGVYKCYRGIEAEITKREREDKSPRKFSDGIVVPVKAMVVQSDLSGVRRTVIEFKSVPEGAEVYVDGVELCNTPCSRELQLGKHAITFQKKDFERISQDVIIDEKSSEVSWSLSDQFGSVVLKNAPKGAVVRVDDLVNTSQTIRMQPGKHIVTVESKYHQPFAKEMNVERGKSQELVFDATPLYGFVEISAKDKKGNAVRSSIMIDGVKQKEMTPATIKVPSGEHQFEVQNQKQGYGQTKTVNPNEKVVLNLVLVDGFKLDATRPSKAPVECNSDNDCPRGKICATVRGEYPGSCAEGGALDNFFRKTESANNEKGCISDTDCPEGSTCAPVKGEFPGSCAEKGGAFFDRIFK